MGDLSDGAPGYDEIPMNIIKYVIQCIKYPLVHIFNASFLEGIFPNKMKIAKIVPIHKGKNKSNPNNYRPIALLPSFSKILEKLFHNRIEQFITSNNILNPNQHGFTKKKSTVSATLSLTDHIIQSFDKKLISIGVFTDISKAFDCVDHQILLNKLKNYGIRYSALLWVKNYLHNRKQFVFHNSEVSEQKLIVNSVPQGSILGPLLFNLYINDLKNAVNNLKLVLYADDSCFYYSNDNLDTLIDVINTELVGVNDWLLSNRLTLNLTKSHFLIFSRRRFLQNNIAPIIINNQIESNRILRFYSTR